MRGTPSDAANVAATLQQIAFTLEWSELFLVSTQATYKNA